jgi:hypothetical protein
MEGEIEMDYSAAGLAAALVVERVCVSVRKAEPDPSEILIFIFPILGTANRLGA